MKAPLLHCMTIEQFKQQNRKDPGKLACSMSTNMDIVVL